jgi:hypothetical protein
MEIMEARRRSGRQSRLWEKAHGAVIPSAARNLSALNAEKKRDSSSLRSSE